MSNDKNEINEFQYVLYKNNEEFLDDYQAKLVEAAHLEKSHYDYLIDRMKEMIEESADKVLIYPAHYWVEKDLKEIEKFHRELNSIKMEFILK